MTALAEERDGPQYPCPVVLPHCPSRPLRFCVSCSRCHIWVLHPDSSTPHGQTARRSPLKKRAIGPRPPSAVYVLVELPLQLRWIEFHAPSLVVSSVLQLGARAERRRASRLAATWRDCNFVASYVPALVTVSAIPRVLLLPESTIHISTWLCSNYHCDGRL